MRDALVADLLALGRHRIRVTADPRSRETPQGVEVVSPGKLDELFASVDLVWLVAPETRGCLEDLAARARRAGARLVGSGPAAIRRAADKAGLSRRFSRRRVPHPSTRSVASDAEGLEAARALGFPVVVKPARGAGSQGVRLARTPAGLRRAMRLARRPGDPILVQRFVPGRAASVSLLCDGSRALPIAVNAQTMLSSPPFSYRGGLTPLDHPLARRAAVVARRACAAIGGLRGFVGVDVVLGASGAVVIEVNPRLTTAYLGVRAALGVNVAALALQACAGRLPRAPRVLRVVRFTAAGRVVAA
jgi:predicted ATP-grasp superfamily ATP-dependent carboligase